jgi:SEC-C motif-containing protein
MALFLGNMTMAVCPCGLKQSFEECCGKYIAGDAFPQTVEQLMRSRYSAFCNRDLHYIANTMRSPALDNFDPDYHDEGIWIKLDVIRSEQQDNKGLVEYNAYYNDHGSVLKLHEISLFTLIANKWYYTDNESHEVSKVNLGRNDACLCGSGIKYKKCCGR